MKKNQKQMQRGSEKARLPVSSRCECDAIPFAVKRDFAETILVRVIWWANSSPHQAQSFGSYSALPSLSTRHTQLLFLALSSVPSKSKVLPSLFPHHVEQHSSFAARLPMEGYQ